MGTASKCAARGAPLVSVYCMVDRPSSAQAPASPAEPGPSLAEQQRRAFLTIAILPMSGVAILVGFLAASLLAMSAFGRFVGIPLFLAVAAAVLACLVIGAVVTIVQGNSHRRRLQDALEHPPVAGVTVPAVLVRVIQGRGGGVHQLLYAMHTAAGVEPVAVVLPGEAAAPRPGSGAWLLVDPSRPDIAAYAQGVDHASALADPALAKPTRSERGLALPGSAYAKPLLIAGAVMLGSFLVFSAVIRLLPA